MKRPNQSTLLTFLSLAIAGAMALPAPAQTAAPRGKAPNRLSLFATELAGKRIMVLGDSITQGGEYVSFVEYCLQKQYPRLDFDIVSVGLASETASGLSEEGHAGGAFPRPCVHERLSRALAAVKPQFVIACYGMNDGIYKPYSDERMKAFQGGITRLVERCLASGAQVVLVTPPVFDIARNRGGSSDALYDQTLARFADWEANSPPAGVAAVVDLHGKMAAALAARKKAEPAFYFSGDGVHPGELGHWIMAQTILEALAAPIPQGSAEQLLAAAKGDPMLELVRRRRACRSEAWLAHIGYTRERAVAPGTGDAAKAEAVAAELQERIDALRKHE
jgi:lysophospholipase L1-like esterase